MILQLRPSRVGAETLARTQLVEAGHRDRLRTKLEELCANPVEHLDRRASLRGSLQDDDDRSLGGIRLRWFKPEGSAMEEIVYAAALERSGKPRKALDRLYRAIDGLIRSGAVAECDRVLRDVNINEMQTHLLVGLLTITASDAHRLSSRSALAKRVRSRLVELAPDRVDKLVAGLE
jgi:hypothetical protein